MNEFETLLDDETGVIRLFPSWYQDSDRLFSDLRNLNEWNSRKIRIYGKEHLIPRMEMWTGEPGITYGYSGMVYESHGWLPALKASVGNLAERLNWMPNSALLNLYRNGGDKMGWHSDDEVELGLNPNLAILSLGNARRLDFRLKSDHTQKIKIELPHGSLLWMQGTLQHHWQHGIQPKVRAGERISCTFRKVLR